MDGGSNNQISGVTVTENRNGVRSPGGSSARQTRSPAARSATTSGPENGFIGIEFVTDSDAIAAGNTITRNGAAGIVNGGAAGFTISHNVIADNEGLGINLLGGREDEFGVTRNSKGGPNFPEIRGATDDGSATVVEGMVDYADPQSVTVELFANDAPDPSGHGEGQELVGTATPDAKGRFTVSLPAGLAGRYITATATGSTGTTSEFSEAVQVGAPKR
ncbi:MAG: right-handed parallel beta-helix repeat-containing protein [Gaiellaceae bacterium]